MLVLRVSEGVGVTGFRAKIDRPILTTAEAATYCGFKTSDGLLAAHKRGDVIALYLLTQPDLEPRQYDFYAGLGFRERGREVLIWNGALV